MVEGRGCPSCCPFPSVSVRNVDNSIPFMPDPPMNPLGYEILSSRGDILFSGLIFPGLSHLWEIPHETGHNPSLILH